MNTAPIRPALIDRDADGTPRSREHDDIYHPRSGALAQARHVFLDDGGLAARWRGQDRFVVLETGFGLGNNFLATWAQWRSDPQRCRRLHFISIESSPPTRVDLASVPRDPSLRGFAEALASRWPPAVWNLHRLVFDEGAVELLLAFGDAEAWLPQLTASVDAFFLDGFAPALNPAMWDTRLFKAMARMAAPAASVATWTAARAVRDGLRGAGFEVALAAGSHGKRDITRATFAPRFLPRPSRRRVETRAAAEGASSDGDRVVIVGAGLAGCALAAALAEHGRASLLLDRGTEIASEASGNAAGLFHGVVHAADGRHARFHRAAALAAHDAVARAVARHGVGASIDGLLRVDPGAAPDGSSIRAVIDRLGLPADYVRALSAAAASELAGVSLASPVWHYAHGGWVDPRALARAWLADAGSLATRQLDCSVATIRRIDDRWSLLDGNGRIVATTATLVFCNGSGAFSQHGASPWPVRRQRGQVSSVDSTDVSGAVPALPITGSGYVLPTIDGKVWFGSTGQWHDDDPGVREQDHRDNLDRWRRLIDAAPEAISPRMSGRTSWRWVSDDRLPIIGAVPATDVETIEGANADVICRGGAPSSRLDQPRFIARAPGLFVFAALGSRGIATASLGSRLLAATITGAPSVVEADLIDAVDPARFISRRFRRDESARNRDASSRAQPPEAGSPGAVA
ncbi:MAG: FAD-dependent 5-carboxymethylaminomethyl-2-thiouridine(34) oxidoreductase MnmC [Caldimonas sp.]